jgi:hypothetical protein
MLILFEENFAINKPGFEFENNPTKFIAVRCTFENANSIFSTNITATLSLSNLVI